MKMLMIWRPTSSSDVISWFPCDNRQLHTINPIATVSHLNWGQHDARVALTIILAAGLIGTTNVRLPRGTIATASWSKYWPIAPICSERVRSTSVTNNLDKRSNVRPATGYEHNCAEY